MQTCGLNGFYTPTQLARWQEVITKRASCRLFTAPPDVAQKSALEYASARVCLPGIRIALMECEPARMFRPQLHHKRIRGATRCAAVIASDASPHAALYAGISGEAFVLETQSLGLGSCWVTGGFRRSACDIYLKPNEKILAVIPVGIAETGNRPRRRKPLARICTSDAAKWPLWAYSAAEAVRWAPSKGNAQPWRLSQSGRSLMLSGRIPASLPFGIAMLHMEAALKGTPHQWRWGTGRNTAILSAEEKT
jgi:hypothetical protein